MSPIANVPWQRIERYSMRQLIDSINDSYQVFLDNLHRRQWIQFNKDLYISVASKDTLDAITNIFLQTTFPIQFYFTVLATQIKRELDFDRVEITTYQNRVFQIACYTTPLTTYFKKIERQI